MNEWVLTTSNFFHHLKVSQNVLGHHGSQRHWPLSHCDFTLGKEHIAVYGLVFGSCWFHPLQPPAISSFVCSLVLQSTNCYGDLLLGGFARVNRDDDLLCDHAIAVGPNCSSSILRKETVTWPGAWAVLLVFWWLWVLLGMAANWRQQLKNSSVSRRRKTTAAGIFFTKACKYVTSFLHSSPEARRKGCKNQLST